MITIIILSLALGIIICVFLYKYSVNKEEWFSSFHYPKESGDVLVYDYDSKKYGIATYDNGWYFKGHKPKNFKWRNLNS